MLTIITPTLNARRYIIACIEHINRERGEGVYHVIVDGGSSDGTDLIVEEYEKKFPHIKLIRDYGGSQSHSMNVGIALSNSRMIGFLNCDDFYEAGTIKQVLQIIPNFSSPTFLCANCQIRDEQGRITSVNKPQALQLIDILAGGVFVPHPVNPSQYFYDRQIHDLIGGYDEQLNFALDLEFIFRVIANVNCVYLNKVWGNFVKSGTAKTDLASANGLLSKEVSLIRKKLILSLTRRQLLEYRFKLAMYFFPRLIKYSYLRLASLFRT